MLRKMEEDDIASTVTLHLESFPGFFLTFLGPRFLGYFYHGVVTASEGIAFVYLGARGQPSGFVAGTSNPQGFYKRLLRKDWLKFCFASVGALIRNPAAIPRVARALIYPAQNPAGEDVAGLFSIGVLPEFQGTGAGNTLVRAFLDEARARGCKRVFLTTDRDNNDSVNNFYQHFGFSIERQYTTPEGRKMNEYWIDL